MAQRKKKATSVRDRAQMRERQRQEKGAGITRGARKPAATKKTANQKKPKGVVETVDVLGPEKPGSIGFKFRSIERLRRLQKGFPKRRGKKVTVTKKP